MASEPGAGGTRAPGARGAGGGGVTLTLLSRAYCHLCEEMRDALVPIAQRFGATIVEVDVDANPALERAHGERVPVLLLGSADGGRELCHYHLATDVVEAALAGVRR